ncbi:MULTISPECIES: nitroreductase family protein [Vagococcus]|uniref:Nitroreductase family protein n=1 Tax=Vagococcus fluvialis bH819 TaxID=1255619 RepID=A0A1X6WMY4_9ENTE|nr:MULTISPECIES: nitroreductase family protein [Vagococcus]SLM85674.1 Nitroreductase family protein [Vagococcus fluvialis bH819]HCM89641.1 nitroreductase [Vagococcus sp.]
MSNFITALKKRRSIYHLGENISLSETEVESLIKEVVRESPSSFNSQTQRVVILFGESNQKLWSITETALKVVTPAEAFEGTQAKLKSFAAGKGTILFFEDTDVVKSLQEQFALYADNFPIWSEQASGLTQANVWTALSEENIGASIQHYNPLIDDAVAKEWEIPASWNLRAQMPFGSIETPAGEKEYMNDADRFKTFK